MVALVKPDNRILDTIIQGDYLDMLRTLDACSVDAIVTDPPAGISFMGKDWDANKGSRDIWINWLSQIMAECLRVLKPGGHALVWALPRTSHWTATAIEDAGFEIRDVLTHLFGSGFPKSHNISAAIDRLKGAEREVIGMKSNLPGLHRSRSGANHFTDDEWQGSDEKARQITVPSTPQAQQWQGYGTALKPANEHWILARKPLSESSIAANVLKWGTGGLNIDQCRVAGESWKRPTTQNMRSGNYNNPDCENLPIPKESHPQGRFPSNLLLSHSWLCTDDLCDEQCPIRLLDEQSGIRKSGAISGEHGYKHYNTGTYGSNRPGSKIPREASEGGASRYFSQFCYTAKASRTERNRGCEGLQTDRPDAHNLSSNACGRCGLRVKANGSGKKCECGDLRETIKLPPALNGHPTVKPLTLMSWLCRLITPPNGIVLDCFAGSGSTLVACVQEGLHFIGIEQSAEYAAIARARIAHALREVQG